MNGAGNTDFGLLIRFKLKPDLFLHAIVNVGSEESEAYHFFVCEMTVVALVTNQ